MTPPLILVVGATGTVGSQVVEQLIQSRQRVRVLVRDPSRLAKVVYPIEVVTGDLSKPATLRAAFAGVDKVFVLAPPAADLEVLEANAFDAAEHAGTSHVVYLSNFGAGDFDGDVWQRHGANERRLRDGEMSWTILRPTRFMSNTPYGWASVHEKGQLVEPHGARKVTLIDPRDIAAVAVKALTDSGHEGKIYELTGEALSGAEMAQNLSAALAKSIQFVDATDEETRDDLVRSGVPPMIAEAVLVYFRTLREGRWYETSTLRELLGCPPRTYAAWLSDHSWAL